MEDFSLNFSDDKTDTNLNKNETAVSAASETELDMSVSPICEKDGRKFAYVSFSGKQKNAEGIIPDCRIVTNKGFTADEVKKLEEYMEDNLQVLKGLSKSVNVMNAFMKN